MDNTKNKVHYVSVTGIVRRDNKFLICKRSPNEHAFPNKWCVPGGKVEVSDFTNTPKDTQDHWLNILERTLTKEIKEETSLNIQNIRYVSSLAFIRPNGFSTIIISLCADWASGEVILNKEELVDYAWVTLAEAQTYDLIENIWEQIAVVEQTSVKNHWWSPCGAQHQWHGRSGLSEMRDISEHAQKRARF